MLTTNRNNTSTSNEKQTVSTFIVPVEAFKDGFNQQTDLRNFHSVVIKTLPNGSLCLVDDSQPSSKQNVLQDTVITKDVNIDIKDLLNTTLRASNRTILLQPQKTNLTNLSIMNNNKFIKIHKEMVPKPVDILFRCIKCKMEFENISLYRKHVVTHKNTKKFNCTKCSLGYNIENNLKIHMAMHCEGKPKCPICGVQFQRMASLKSHLLLHQVEELYNCEECHAEFEREDELLKHMEIHAITKKTDSKALVCSYCKVEFQKLSEYKEHISFHIKVKKIVLKGKRTKRSKIDKEYGHVCSKCGKTFPKASLLERHERIHSGERPYQCQYCYRAFTQKGTLQIHLTKHTGLKPFKCTLCPARFNQKGNLRVHIEKTHTAPTSGEKIYKCSLCTCIFKKVASLNGHMTKTHTQADDDSVTGVIEKLKNLEKQTTAPVSKTTEPDSPKKVSNEMEENEKNVDEPSENENVKTEPFESMNPTYVKLAESGYDGSIRRYLVKQKKIGDVRWYFCNYCDRQFKKPSDLIRHIRVHTGEKPFKCKQCGAAFSLKSTLVSHTTTHIDKKDYKCVLCEATFASLRSLNAHLKKHDKNFAANYQCIVCNKFFATIEMADYHKNVHSDKENYIQPVLKQPLFQTPYGTLPLKPPKPKVPNTGNESPQVRPHHCVICDARFSRLINLKRHIQFHNEDRKFKCDICPKAFISSYRLKEHMKYHNNIRNYSCKICHKKFIGAYLLKRHLLVHNTHKPYLCPYCSKTFKTLLLCRNHIKKVHKTEVNKAVSVAQDLQTEQDANVEQATLETSIATQFFEMPKNNFDNNMYKTVIVQDTSGNLENIQNHSFYQIPQSETQTAIQILSGNQNSEDLITDPSQLNYETIFVCDDIPLGDNTNICNSVFSQIKLQNTDSLLLNSMNDLPDNNMLFNIDTINSDLETPTEVYNPNSIFTTTTNDDDNISTLPSISEISPKKLNNFHLKTVPTDINTETLNLNSLLSGNISLYPNVTFSTDLNLQQKEDNASDDNFSVPISLPENSCTDPNNITVFNSFNLPINTDLMICLACNKVFENTQDFEGHICNNLENNVVNLKDLELDKEEEANKDVTNIVVEEIGENNGETTGGGEEKEKTKKKTRTFECVECRKIFSSCNRGAYVAHLTTHSQKGDCIRTCKFCLKEFKKPSDLKRHLRTHTGEKPYGCYICEKKFSLKSTLDSHVRTHDPTTVKEFNCSVCNTFFSSRASLKVHMLLHSGKKPHPCSFCPLKFRTAAHKKSHEFTQHIAKAHKEKDNGTKITNLLESVATEVVNSMGPPTTDLNSAVIVEGVSDSQVLQNGDISHHLNILPVSDVPEDIAEPISIDTVALLQHLQSGILIQDGSDADSMPPEFISLEDVALLNFKPVTNVENKEETEMVEPPNDNTDKNLGLECDICHKTYSSKHVLRRHKKIHERVSYSCDKCDKDFVTLEAFNKHIKLHPEFRAFDCIVCNTRFLDESSLMDHMKRTHNISNVTKDQDSPNLLMKFDLNLNDNLSTKELF